MSAGRFITFEGVEGSGKTTQLEMLAARLRAAGQRVVTTREPGGTPLGEQLRALLLHPGTDPVPLAELFLLEAARAQLTQRVVLPALAAGCFVLADRYADSSLAYQGTARGLGWDTVALLNAQACGGLRPHRTLVLELPVEEALQRARGRAETTADNRRFEDEALAFHARVAEGYRRLAREEPERVRLVDGRGEREAVHTRVLAALEGVLP